jgi:hypothetical protein
VVEYSWGTTRTLGRWARDDRLDQILHVGDISYADDRIHLNNGTFYQGILNYFYNVVSSYGAKVSYATTPGNHEASCNFNDYLGRNPTPFIESGSPSSMFYAFTNQRVRFIATSTEEHERNPKPHNEDYFNQQGAQYKWLKAHLEDASRARAAGEIDWIIGIIVDVFVCGFITSFSDSVRYSLPKSLNPKAWATVRCTAALTGVRAAGRIATLTPQMSGSTLTV